MNTSKFYLHIQATTLIAILPEPKKALLKKQRPKSGETSSSLQCWIWTRFRILAQTMKVNREWKTRDAIYPSTPIQCAQNYNKQTRSLIVSASQVKCGQSKNKLIYHFSVQSVQFGNTVQFGKCRDNGKLQKMMLRVPMT